MSYPAEDYYNVLDLPTTATQEEIKQRYKQYVRAHHPDRFTDPDEKAAAEERVKSINEAYQVLSSQAMEGQLVRYMQREMGLQVTPEAIDFGVVERRQRVHETFRVQFEKDVESMDFVPSEEDSWFRVSKVSHLYDNAFAALEFEVEADSTGLTAQTHQGWIDLYLDTTMVRVPLSLAVTVNQSKPLDSVRFYWNRLHLSRRWALAATFVLAILVFTTALTFTATRTFSQPQRPIGADGIIQQQSNQLYFSLLDHGTPSVYTTFAQNATLPLLLTEGSQAAVFAEQQLVAYLGKQEQPTQIFLHDQIADQTTQVTTDETRKSQLAWSYDGQQLAYLIDGGTSGRIGLYDVNDATEYRLPGTVTAGVSSFAWSPTDDTLLFDLWQNEERHVYRMAVPDGELKQLTRFDSWGGTWSPDAKEIMVAAKDGLYRLDSQGNNLQQVSNLPADQPRWSAEGNWIAYTTRPLDQPQTASTAAVDSTMTAPLWLMRPDGSDLRQIVPNSLWHAWSPTGERLGFITGVHTATNVTAEAELYYLWMLEPGGTSQLIAEVNEPFFTWSR